MNFEIFNTNINLAGLIVGIWVFIIIIFARWLCIWGEYHFSKKFWIFFLIIGFIGVLTSLFIKNDVFSTMLAALGFIYLWGINETIEQEKRVEKGWFPKNKKRL